MRSYALQDCTRDAHEAWQRMAVMNTLRGLLATTLVALLLDTLSRMTSTNLGLFVAAQQGWEGVGTWSTGNGMVLTGPVSATDRVGLPYRFRFLRTALFLMADATTPLAFTAACHRVSECRTTTRSFTRM